VGKPLAVEGLTVVSIVQAWPSHNSAYVKWLKDPFAKPPIATHHEALVQDTPLRLLDSVVDELGLGMIVQLTPFHISVRVCWAEAPS
jgi:hypothetical protein